MLGSAPLFFSDGQQPCFARPAAQEPTCPEHNKTETMIPTVKRLMYLVYTAPIVFSMNRVVVLLMCRHPGSVVDVPRQTQSRTKAALDSLLDLWGNAALSTTTTRKNICLCANW
jgi:hypothetical protein